jgi:hypothetical protein
MCPSSPNAFRFSIRKRPRLVAEQLGLQHGVRDRGAVDLDERALGARAPLGNGHWRWPNWLKVAEDGRHIVRDSPLGHERISG